VAKWKKRSSTADLPTGPKVARSTVLSIEDEAMIVAFRRHALLPLDDCLYALQATIPYLTRSSLHRCLQRHGISQLPTRAGDAPAKRKFKSYPIGYFHIDIADVRTEQGKLYMLVAIDRASKFAFVELHEKATTRVAADFLRHLIASVPSKVHTVFTDNPVPSEVEGGIHFTDPKYPGSAVERGEDRQRRTVPLPLLRARLRSERHRSPSHQGSPERSRGATPPIDQTARSNG
jgi:hypothetical protein